MEPWAIVMLGGVLPFGSIFIEVWVVYWGKGPSLSALCHRYFIFTSFWQYKIYYVFGFMLLVYIIMLVVTVCVTIVCTYFLLNSEDYRWYVAPYTNYIIMVPMTVSTGSGPVSVLEALFQYMSISILSTTSSSRQSQSTLTPSWLAQFPLPVQDVWSLSDCVLLQLHGSREHSSGPAVW